jgi:Xaa-Pro dipeptidase
VSASSLDQLYLEHLQTQARRADAALSASGFDALVIYAGPAPVLFLDDQDYPFKVNPHFKAWVPVLDNARSVLVYVPGDKPTLLFHRPDDFWHKPGLLPTEPWTAGLQVISMPDPAGANAHWAGKGRIAIIGSGSAAVGPHESVNPPELLARLHFDRAVKTPYELACMRHASDLGALGHLAAFNVFQGGGSEYEAHMAYLCACQQREEEMPYNNIVAYNENAAVLHYQHLERVPPSSWHSFLIDAGAQFRGYACDITRTYARSPGRFAELVRAMDQAQLSLCAEIVSGKDFRDVHLSAHRVLGDVMKQMNLIHVDGQTALEQGVTSVFFPHGIGHLLGLQVHDVGGVMGDVAGQERERPKGHPYLRLTRLLEPGVVVTVEPGLYFIDSLLAKAFADERRAHINWNIVDELRPFGGIRIEDNVVAGSGGPENLTRDAFAKIRA